MITKWISETALKSSRSNTVSLQMKQIRYVSTDPFIEKAKNKKIRFYFFHKYVDYIKSYNTTLENRFPKTVSTYKGFMFGVKEFYKDVMEFIKINRIINNSPDGLRTLTRRELELYDKIPNDMWKVAPILITSALPFANYIILPLIFMFPRQLLTSHFWNIEQKNMFRIYYLRQKLFHNRPIFRHLQTQLPLLKDHKLYDKWNNVLGCIGSGIQPSTLHIVECKELFLTKPFHIKYLTRNHVKHLIIYYELSGCFLNGCLLTSWYARRRLEDKAGILKTMDHAIIMEGGAQNLPLDALRNACYLRGLNPTNLKTDEMVEWIKRWLVISQAVDKESYSLLLHASILLGYNEPSNWQLIYDKKLDC